MYACMDCQNIIISYTWTAFTAMYLEWQLHSCFTSASVKKTKLQKVQHYTELGELIDVSKSSCSSHFSYILDRTDALSSMWFLKK